MTGLVLEGGTFRAIFSAGVMDAFMEKGIEFPYVVGVSAGISNAASYISKQSGRNLTVLKKYRNDKRYMGAGNLMDCRSFFGLNFVFDEIPNTLVPFDYDTFRSYKGKYMVGVTNAETGKSEFFDGIKDSDKWEYLRATCALPGAFEPQMIDGKPYYDGGLASPICVKRALKDGCDRVVIVLTQPKGFVKKCGKGNVIAGLSLHKKYPNIENALLIRHKLYNAQLSFCEELERRGKALIIRPDESMNSFEKDTRVIESNYNKGYKKGLEYADRAAELLNI
ncbi:MAG: patatin family protein [Oscillospiraceae bacterium]|nr:patatin family protein [Oscillospiraceae bacterium]